MTELTKSDNELETSEEKAEEAETEEVSKETEDEEAQKSEEETSEETPLKKEKVSEQKPSEYTKERFDGLMSSWQKDRTKTLELEKEINELKSKLKENSSEEEKTVEYYAEKIAEKQRQKAEKEKQQADSEIAFTISSMQSRYPDFDHKKVIPIINKYYDEEDLANPAKLMATFEKGYKLFQDLQKEKRIEADKARDNLRRKKDASTIGGKGVIEKGGLKTYDAKRDKGKSFSQLLKEGLKELT